jgi:hypothetical protein
MRYWLQVCTIRLLHVRSRVFSFVQDIEVCMLDPHRELLYNKLYDIWLEAAFVFIAFDT